MQLKEWLHQKNKTQRWLAKKLDTTDSYLSLIKTGAKIPGRKMAARIEALTGGDVTVDELRRTRPLSLQAKVKARLKSKFAS